jgi:hypothetical protein
MFLRTRDKFSYFGKIDQNITIKTDLWTKV